MQQEVVCAEDVTCAALIAEMNNNVKLQASKARNVSLECVIAEMCFPTCIQCYGGNLQNNLVMPQ